MKIKNKYLLGVAILSLFVLAVMIPTLMPNSQPDEQLEFYGTVRVEVYRPINGTMAQVYRHESSNVITNIGLHVISRQISGQNTYLWTAALGGNDLYYNVGDAKYIALSTDNTGVDAVHSSWQAVDGSYPGYIEIITGGLQRATGTYTQATSYTAGSGGTKGSITYSLTRTFTVTAGNSFAAVRKAGLFNGAYNTNDGLSSGTGGRITPLIAENTFPPVDLNAGDQIAVTWRITL